MGVGGIVVCEVGFWVFLVAGLGARYLLRMPRLGLGLLLCSPLLDVGLLVLTAADLAGGGAATQAHALAAVYIGATVAFGPGLIDWADRRFAGFAGFDDRLAHRPTRVASPLRHEWREFGKAAVTWAISGALLGAGAWIAGDPASVRVLMGSAGVLSLVLVIWFVAGPLATTLGAASRLARGHAESFSVTERKPPGPGD